MQLNPYLHFNGTCEEAFKFYEKALNGKIQAMMTYAGTPAEAHCPPDWKNKILHASLIVDGEVLMASDVAPAQYKGPQGFSVSISIKNPSDGERVFHALAEGGKVGMPFQKTFWASGFGTLTDRFGIPWMVNCE
jgi:PhnB protein